MSDTQEEVQIRLAKPEDTDNIIDFLRVHWIIKNHVFTRRRDLFDNCHLIEGRLTFLLAEGVETKALYGLLGYSFNNHDFERPDISAVIFQTLKTANTSLGIDMILALQDLTNCRSLFSPGILKKTKGLYDFLGYTTGQLRHYYKLGRSDGFKIARIARTPRIGDYPGSQCEMRELGSFEDVCAAFDFESCTDVMPHRDAWSVEQRYFKNIGYDYDVYGMVSEGACRALLVGREIAYNGAKMFRIVDFIGDDEMLGHAGEALDNLMRQNEYEYMDFYEVGIDDGIMRAAGFALREPGDENIVPSYFEPYECENIDIWYYTTWPGKFHIYRTDAGQDRPNFIEEIKG